MLPLSIVRRGPQAWLRLADGTWAPSVAAAGAVWAALVFPGTRNGAALDLPTALERVPEIGGSVALCMEVHLVLWRIAVVAFVKWRGVRWLGSGFVVAFLNHIGCWNI